MVSLNTVLAVGGIAAAYFIFKNLGGASGIGSKIGGGVAAFGTSLTESLNPLQNVFAQQEQQDPIYERYLAGERTANTLPFDENPSFIIKKDEPEIEIQYKPKFPNIESIIPSLPSAGAVEYQGPKQQTESEYYGPEVPSKIPPYAGSLEYIFGNTTTNNQYNSNPALQGTGVLNLAGTNVRTSTNANPYGNFANPEYA